MLNQPSIAPSPLSPPPPFMPILRRLSAADAKGARCQVHGLDVAFYDVKRKDQPLCKECVVEAVVEKDFNVTMSKEGNLFRISIEFEKKKQTEDFLEALEMMDAECRRLKMKIIREIESVEKEKEEQDLFLKRTFSQISDLLSELHKKYIYRVEKTQESIKSIFSDKLLRLSKFEKELSELEKDVRLNYINIIKLMDIEPFYEIIYRYNMKLGKIKQVFTEFKNKPQEIREQAIKVKNLNQRMSFISNIAETFDNYLSECDGIDSMSNSGFFDDQRILITLAPTIEEISLGPILDIATKIKPTMECGSTQTDEPVNNANNKHPGCQRYRQSDELKEQAEILIRSVDSLISATGDTDMKSACFTNAMLSNPQYASKAKALAHHLNSSGIGSSNQNRFRDISDPKDKSLNLSKPRNSRKSLSQKNTGKLNLTNYRSGNQNPSPKKRLSVTANSKIHTKFSSPQNAKPASHSSKALTKTERLLQLYRKNRMGSGGNALP